MLIGFASTILYLYGEKMMKKETGYKKRPALGKQVFKGSKTMKKYANWLRKYYLIPLW